MDDLDLKIKQYYGNIRPDSNLIKELKDKITASENERENKWVPFRWKIILKFAAFIALFFTSTYFIYQFSSDNDSNQYYEYAKEIAYNHTKGLNAEYLTSSITELNHYMDKLDFSIINSEMIKDYTWSGARYCSVQGAIAAQIKLKDSKNNVCTLYEFKQNDENDLEKSQTYFIAGVKVMLWSDSGVIFGLAEDKN
ncbi:MAG: hypothetical protein WD577_05025 [Bacteroidales bacterium]